MNTFEVDGEKIEFEFIQIKDRTGLRIVRNGIVYEIVPSKRTGWFSVNGYMVKRPLTFDILMQVLHTDPNDKGIYTGIFLLADEAESIERLMRI